MMINPYVYKQNSSSVEKVYTIRGPAGLVQHISSLTDDGYFGLPAVPFSFYLSGKNFGQSDQAIFVCSNSFITFGSPSNAHSNLGALNPPYPKLLINAGDRSYKGLYSGSLDNGKSYTVRFEGNQRYDNNGAVVIWEATFYSDGCIVLVTDSAFVDSGVSGLASDSSYYTNNQLSGSSAYLYSPLNSDGTAWSFEKKA
jgi:hypothetical protein